MPTLRCLAAVLLLTLGSAIDQVRAQGAQDADSMPGVHLVLQLDAADIRAQWLNTLRDEIRSRLRDAKINIGRLVIGDNAVQLRLANPEDLDAVLKLLGDLAPAPPRNIYERWLGSVGRDVSVASSEGGNVTIAPTEAGLKRRTDAALDDAVSIAGRRLEGMGIGASATRRGLSQIKVHAPALKEATSLKALLTKPGRLGFHEVHATITAEKAREARVPLGYRLYSSGWGDLLLRESPAMRGSDLVDAQAAFDQRTNEPVISFRFNANGARAFSKFTGEHIGQPFAIVLDDVVLSAPVIREPILGGSGQISGNFTVEDARRLAVQLRGGALPGNLSVVEERVVPASR